MHPAVSIILFTTLSGCGLGLGVWTVIASHSDNVTLAFVQATVAAALGGAGLVCSVFHLRRPFRAWRALSQWRSSWLSREGILAPAALAAVFAYGVSVWVGVADWPALALRVLGFVFCSIALFATAMIYAQIKAVPAWNTALTPVFFLLFAGSSGGLLYAATSVAFGNASSESMILAAVMVIAAWVAKLAWWRRLDRTGTGDSSIESATGITELGEVRLLEPPHTGSNYLLSEMAFVVARKHAVKLRRIAVLTGGILPLACLAFAAAGHFAPAAILCALLFHLLGVGISRWLFFAESKHTVALYYGR